MGTEAVESSDKRRARLRALRAAQELSNADAADLIPTPTAPSHGNGNDNGNGQHQDQDHDGDGKADADMKFQNYFPRDGELQKAKHPPPVIPKFEDPVATDPLQVTEVEDPIVSIAPKKPNSDLRRDVAKKLEKLERRTQRAIVELMNTQVESPEEPLLHNNEPEASDVVQLKRKDPIYLSHSDAQKKFVEQLHTDLERARHAPLFNYKRPDNLSMGQLYAQIIFQAAR